MDIEKKTKALRGALFGYLLMLGSLDVPGRVRADAAFKAVRAGLLHSGIVLQLTRAEADAVKAFLLAEQWNQCAMTGQRLTSKGACLDHCHRTGRVRGVLSRPANGYEGGQPATGKLATMNRTTLNALVAQYRRTAKPTDLLYPTNR